MVRLVRETATVICPIQLLIATKRYSDATRSKCPNTQSDHQSQAMSGTIACTRKTIEQDPMLRTVETASVLFTNKPLDVKEPLACPEIQRHHRARLIGWVEEVDLGCIGRQLLVTGFR